MKTKILLVALIALLLVGTVMAKTAPEISTERIAPRPQISAIAIIKEPNDPEPRRQSTTNLWLQNRPVWVNQNQWYNTTTIEGLICWEDIGMCIISVTPILPVE